MPASLRPNLLATITLATTVSMTGCIFPFTRSSDTKLAELVTADAQPQPKQQVATPIKAEGEKKLPPFARFIGGMFGGEKRSDSAPESNPIPHETTEPVNRVAEVPPKTAGPQPSIIQPARDLVETKSKTPVVNPPTNNMPVVVTPDTNTMEDKPDVVSRFSQKATQLIDKPLPEVVVESKSSPQPKPQPSVEPSRKPQVAQTTPANLGDEALDAHARTPWEEKKLLEKAMANSSTSTTTLEHSLELALETVRRERLGKPPETTVEAKVTPQPGVTAQATLPETTAKPAQTSTSHQPTKVASNPLRSSGTKTDWSGSSLRNSQPQTITKDTLTKYPQTDSKWAPKLSPSQPAPEEVAKQPEPAADPQVTVNPYANSDEEVKPESAKSSAPGLVNNDSTEADSDPQPTTTDEIHFQSSLLSKLQAANRQAKWDFSSEAKPVENSKSPTASLEPDMPKIVDSDVAAKSDLPMITSEQSQTQPTIPQLVDSQEITTPKVAQTEPKTTMNPSVAHTDEEDKSQVIKPFIIAAPARVTPAQRGLIRAAEPRPLVMENKDGNWQNASATPATPAKPLPKLAPVVRASDYQSPDSSSSGSKTYIVN